MACNLRKLSATLSLHRLHVRPLLHRSGVTCNLCKLNVALNGTSTGHRRDTDWTPTGHRGTPVPGPDTPGSQPLQSWQSLALLGQTLA